MICCTNQHARLQRRVLRPRELVTPASMGAHFKLFQEHPGPLPERLPGYIYGRMNCSRAAAA